MYDQNVQSPRRVELQRKIKLYEETFDMMICKLGLILSLPSILVLLPLLLECRFQSCFLPTPRPLSVLPDTFFLRVDKAEQAIRTSTGIGGEEEDENGGWRGRRMEEDDDWAGWCLCS